MPIYQQTLQGDLIQIARTKQAKKPRKTVGKFLLLGAGLQSSLLVELVLAGELEQPDMVIFADTGNEPQWVYRQVTYLKNRLDTANIEFAIVSNGHIVEDFQNGTRYGFASMPLYTKNKQSGRIGQLRRQCTNEYKIVPADNVILDWLVSHGHATTDSIGRRRVKRDIQVEHWYGITTDEGFRMSKQRSWRKPRYPLIELNMSRTDCVKWYRQHGLPVPKKSSCIVCPYHNNDYWQALPPDEFEMACQFDDQLRQKDSHYFDRTNDDVYLHPSCVPLRDIDFDTITNGKHSPFQIAMMLEGGTCNADGGFSCAT